VETNADFRPLLKGNNEIHDGSKIDGHLAKVGAVADLTSFKVLEKDIAFKAGTDWGVFLSHAF